MLDLLRIFWQEEDWKRWNIAKIGGLDPRKAPKIGNLDSRKIPNIGDFDLKNRSFWWLKTLFLGGPQHCMGSKSSLLVLFGWLFSCPSNNSIIVHQIYIILVTIRLQKGQKSWKSRSLRKKQPFFFLFNRMIFNFSDVSSVGYSPESCIFGV